MILNLGNIYIHVRIHNILPLPPGYGHKLVVRCLCYSAALYCRLCLTNKLLVHVLGPNFLRNKTTVLYTLTMVYIGMSIYTRSIIYRYYNYAQRNTLTSSYITIRHDKRGPPQNYVPAHAHTHTHRFPYRRAAVTDQGAKQTSTEPGSVTEPTGRKYAYRV